jgi:hypothetical protein
MKSPSVKIVCFLLLTLSFRIGAQSVIQRPECTGILHGVVYDLSAKHAVGAKVTAWPLGVDVEGFLPNATADEKGEYRFEHVCKGKYTVIPEDINNGYPSISPYGYEFLYAVQTKAARLNFFHRDAEIPVHLPPKPGLMLLKISNAQSHSDIQKFKVILRVPGQRLSPEASMSFDANVKNREVAVPSGRTVAVRVSADGLGEFSRSVFVHPGGQIDLNADMEPLK